MSRLMHDKNGKTLGVFDRRFVPLVEIQPEVSDHDIAILIKAFTSLTDPHSLWAKEDPDYIPRFERCYVPRYKKVPRSIKQSRTSLLWHELGKTSSPSGRTAGSSYTRTI